MSKNKIKNEIGQKDIEVFITENDSGYKKMKEELGLPDWEDETTYDLYTKEQIKGIHKNYANFDVVRTFTACCNISDSFNVEAYWEYLQTLDFVSKIVFVIHDKDYYTLKDLANLKEKGIPASLLPEVGQKKKRHFHIICSMSKTHLAGNTIADALRLPTNMVQRLRKGSNFKKASQYAIHLNDPDKAQYAPDVVYANFEYQKIIIKDIVKTQSRQQREELITDILDGKIRRYELDEEFAKRGLPRYLLKDWRSHTDTAFKIADEFYLRDNKERVMDVVFITARYSEAGKTELAKYLCKQRGYKDKEIYITGAARDFMEKYLDQKVIIVDDFRPEMFDCYADAIKFMDNYNGSDVGSRFYNKVLKSELIIFTSVLDVDEAFYYDDAIREDKWQHKRRINYLIEMCHDHCFIYAPDSDLRRFVDVDVINNPVPDLVKAKIQKQGKRFDYASLLVESAGRYENFCDEKTNEKMIEKDMKSGLLKKID